MAQWPGCDMFFAKAIWPLREPIRGQLESIYSSLQLLGIHHALFRGHQIYNIGRDHASHIHTIRKRRLFVNELQASQIVHIHSLVSFLSRSFFFFAIHSTLSQNVPGLHYLRFDPSRYHQSRQGHPLLQTALRRSPLLLLLLFSFLFFLWWSFADMIARKQQDSKRKRQR